VWERVWRIQVCVHSRAFSWLELTSDLWLMTRQNATRVKHEGSWRVMTAGALQDKKGKSGQLVITRLELATCPSREWVAKTPCFAKKWLFTFLTYPTINTLILTKCKELLEGILREKPWRFDQKCATRRWLASSDSPKWSTCVKHAGRWRVRTAGSLQDKKYSLA